MSRRSPQRPGPVARQGRVVYRAPRRFDLGRIITSAREMIKFRRPSLLRGGRSITAVVQTLAPREWPALRVVAVGLWAITTVRLVSTYTGSGLHVGSLSAWVVPAVALLLGIVCWGLPWLRVPVDHLLGAIVVGIALPLLYLSIAGNVGSRDLASIYIVLAVFTAAVLPIRTAMAVALLGAVAAAVPLIAGWTVLYERALLLLVCVIGLIVYTQTRMLGSVGRRTREAEERARQIEESYMTTLGALSAMVFGNDGFAESHARATALLAVAVGQQLGLKGRALRQLESAALLHDVGKVGLPARVLTKPGPLSREELVLVHAHPVVAERILSRIPSLKAICPIVRAQYERWNGSGYPDGLAGDAIPLGGRILHACAAFHAMSSERPYRAALSTDEVIRELRSQAGSQFDPRIVEALVAVVQPAGAELSPERPLLQRIQDREAITNASDRETGEQQICRLTVEVAANLMPHDQARVYLVAGDKLHLVPAYFSPPERPEAPRALENRILVPGEGVAGTVFETRMAVVLGDVDAGAVGLEAPDLKVSAVAAPVLVNGDMLGVIEVVKIGLRQYNKTHLRLLKILANQMAVSVANSRMIDRLAA